jgi:hypothetical protein
MPASLKTVVATNATKGINATTGMYLLKHRANLHSVQEYGATICNLTVAQQKFDCDAVFECVGFFRANSGCGHQILEEYDVRKCKARYHLPTTQTLVELSLSLVQHTRYRLVT